MSACPICANKTLRHIHHNQVYWYCSHCHEAVPNLSSASAYQDRQLIKNHQLVVPVPKQLAVAVGASV